MLTGFWFGVIAVLWAGFFVLEGFDFGVGMLLPFVGRTEAEREQALRAIGPVWDGNEVWLLVAGGATFAAFPEWYATVFSGFYLAFALLLVGLILRGIGIEYRGKAHSAQGRRWCEAAVVAGSFVPALLLGVAFGNFVRGVDLNAAHDMTNGFFSLLNPYALLGGLVSLTMFAFHGAAFLGLRTEGPVSAAARRLSPRLGVVALVLATGWVLWTTQVRGGWVSQVVALVIVIGLVLAVRAVSLDRYGIAFSATALAAGLVPVWAFACLWPDVLPARNDSALSLTADQASSSHYTLAVMTVVALLVTPVVLVYQAWTYWVFRARIGVPAEPAPHGTGTAGTVAGRAREAARRFAPTELSAPASAATQERQEQGRHREPTGPDTR